MNDFSPETIDRALRAVSIPRNPRERSVLLDLLIVCGFFLLSYFGKIGISSLTLAGLFGVLALVHIIKGERL